MLRESVCVYARLLRVRLTTKGWEHERSGEKNRQNEVCIFFFFLDQTLHGAWGVLLPENRGFDSPFLSSQRRADMHLCTPLLS